jgi:hypothetical protein
MVQLEASQEGLISMKLVGVYYITRDRLCDLVVRVPGYR